MDVSAVQPSLPDHVALHASVGGPASSPQETWVYPPVAGQALPRRRVVPGDLGGGAAASHGRRVPSSFREDPAVITDDNGLLAIRVVLARHRRRRHPDRTRCAWCHHIYPCAERQHATDLLRAVSDNQSG